MYHTIIRYIITRPITAGTMLSDLGCAVWLLILIFGSALLYNLFSPIMGIYYWIVEPSEEFQNKFLEPSLQKIVSVPYNELSERKKQFIVTIDGVEVLCTYNLDTSWFTGYENGRTGHSLLMAGGKIISQITRKDIGKKINIIVEPHNPKTKDEDFHSFEKSYAAVPNGEWYTLVPFEEFAEQTKKKEKEQQELLDKEKEQRLEQKKIEEDAKIERIN